MGAAGARGAGVAAALADDAAGRRGALWAIRFGAVAADELLRGEVVREEAGARCAAARAVVSGPTADPAVASMGSVSAAPLWKRRTAAGESAICAVEYSRNAPGSGFGDASSRAKRSRISSLTTR